MVLAELHIWHSRPIAPTRRVALGDGNLPVDPAPGPGGLLLGAVMARFGPDLDDELRRDVRRLMREVERGVAIGQPRLRHRYQHDRVGLTRSRHLLIGGADGLRFELETSKASPVQSVLAAVYACEDLDADLRSPVLRVLRRGFEWVGPIGAGLVEHLVGADLARQFHSGAFTLASDSLLWAFDVLGLEPHDDPAPTVVQRRYRALLRDAHPDHGGVRADAADRIATLVRAREILLSP